MSDVPQVFLFIFLIKAAIVSMHQQLYYGDIRVQSALFAIIASMEVFRNLFPFITSLQVDGFGSWVWYWLV